MRFTLSPLISLNESSPNLQELLERARQVIVAESAAVLSAAESLDQNFVAVAEVLLACSGKLLITGSGTSGTIARRSSKRW